MVQCYGFFSMPKTITQKPIDDPYPYKVGARHLLILAMQNILMLAQAFVKATNHDLVHSTTLIHDHTTPAKDLQTNLQGHIPQSKRVVPTSRVWVASKGMPGALPPPRAGCYHCRSTPIRNVGCLQKRYHHPKPPRIASLSLCGKERQPKERKKTAKEKRQAGT